METHNNNQFKKRIGNLVSEYCNRFNINENDFREEMKKKKMVLERSAPIIHLCHHRYYTPQDVDKMYVALEDIANCSFTAASRWLLFLFRINYYFKFEFICKLLDRFKTTDKMMSVLVWLISTISVGFGWNFIVQLAMRCRNEVKNVFIEAIQNQICCELKVLKDIKNGNKVHNELCSSLVHSFNNDIEIAEMLGLDFCEYEIMVRELNELANKIHVEEMCFLKTQASGAHDKREVELKEFIEKILFA